LFGITAFPFTSKSVAVTYTVSVPHIVNPSRPTGHLEELSFNLETGDRIYGNFAVSGGSNDVNSTSQLKLARKP